MQARRVVILGGSGFIGTNLLLALRERGTLITSCSRRGHRFRPPIPGVDYVTVDLTSLPDLRPVLGSADLIFDLSMLSLPDAGETHPGQNLSCSVAYTLQVLKQCLEVGVKKLVFASSGGAVYGVPRATPITEGHPTNPISFYGVEKLAVEKYLEVLRRHGLEAITVRLANIYGPHQEFRGRCGLAAVALVRALTGEAITVWGDGSVVRDFLYVGDACDALLRVGFGSVRHRIYNIASGEGVTMRALLEMIPGVTGRPLNVEYRPGRPMDVPVNILARERIISETGWAPTTGLREGLAQTWEWLCAAAPGAGRQPDPGPDGRSATPAEPSRRCPLTAAHLEILRACLTAPDADEVELGHMLYRSPHTVHTEMKQIYERLEVHSRTAALLSALREEWIALPSARPR